MARYPKPDGWKGGSIDGRILRTFDGHLGINVETDPDYAADHDARRNERSFDESDIGSYDGEAL